MLAQGLIDEVRALRARDLHPGLPSVRCVGYRQMWAHLDGEIDLAGAREQASPPRASWPSARSPGCGAAGTGHRRLPGAGARTIDAVAALGERA